MFFCEYHMLQTIALRVRSIWVINNSCISNVGKLSDDQIIKNMYERLGTFSWHCHLLMWDPEQVTLPFGKMGLIPTLKVVW